MLEHYAFPGTPVDLDYTNWKGERRTRRILPLVGSIRCAETPWHTPAQWVFDAFDLERDGEPIRTFAMKDVHSWRPA